MLPAGSIRPWPGNGRIAPSRSIAASCRPTWRTRVQVADARLRSPFRSGAAPHPRAARCGRDGVRRSGGGDRRGIRDHAGGGVAAPEGAAREQLCKGPCGRPATTLFGGCRRASGRGRMDRKVQEFLGAEAGRTGNGDSARQASAAQRAGVRTYREESVGVEVTEQETLATWWTIQTFGLAGAIAARCVL